MTNTTSRTHTLLWVFGFLILLICNTASGLKEAEVGKWEWYKQGLGLIVDASFTSNDINVATSHSVAQLSRSTGSINWKRQFSERVNAFVSSSQRVVTLSNCDTIDLWSGKGSLVKHDNINTFEHNTSSLCTLSLPTYQEHPSTFVVSTANILQIRSLKSAALLWSTETDGIIVSASAQEHNDKLVLDVVTIGRTDHNNAVARIEQYTFRMETNKKQRSLELVTDEPRVATSTPVEVDPTLIVQVRQLSVNAIFCQSSDGTLFSIKTSPDFIIEVLVETEFKVSKFLSPPNKLPVVVETIKGEPKVLGNSPVNNHVVRLSFSQDITKEIAFVDQDKLLNLFLSDKDASFGLAVFKDHSLVLFNSGKEVWRRHEALANIVESKFVDLPNQVRAVNIEDQAGALSLFIDRVTKQFEQLKALAQKITEAGISHLARNSLENNLERVQDRFGFRKIIVVFTASGSVFGIDTASGDVSWTLDKFALTETYSETVVPHKMFVAKSQHHTSDIVVPEVTLVFYHTNAVIMISVDAINGKVTLKETFTSDSTPLHTFSVPYTSNDHTTPCILVRSDLTAKVFPQRLSSLVNEHAHNTYFHIVDRATGAVSGYRLVSADKVEKVWNHHYENEIIAYTRNMNSDNTGIQSNIYRSADGFLYKYLNPHLFAVVLQAEIPSARRTKYIQIQLIDSVTGAIVQSVVQTGATGPIEILIDGNQVICSFTNVKARRQEIASLELFSREGKQEVSVFSSFDHHDVYFIGKTFVLSHTVDALGTTVTSQGITIKNTLFGLSRNQVVMVPKRLLDARRPLGKPSTAEIEEGLIPYKPMLELDPKSVLTHRYEVNDIRSIVSSPTHLESTTHVFVVGTDLYYTRLSPNSRYDMLTEGFNPIPVIGSIVVLVIGAIASRWFAVKRQLTNKWK